MMARYNVPNEVLKSKFRACLAGVVLGDCLGVPFEGIEKVVKRDLSDFLNALDQPDAKLAPLRYSDDTAMTRSIAESLVENQKVDENDIAQRFTDVYFKEPNRGYGEGVVQVFTKWRTSLDDLWNPAKEQYNGDGSYGNGGAMRVAPIALFCHNSHDLLVKTVTSVTKLTHTNPLAISGALFQSMAIQQALSLDPDEKLDEKIFLKNLREKIEAIEETIYDDHGFDLGKNWYYRNRINIIEKLLEECRLKNVSDEEVVSSLGHYVDALNSVPTALFCFLRSTQKIPHIQTNNALRRTIEYAISLGGDTDTIASMAAALVGSYYGEEVIPQYYLKHTEAGKELAHLGEKLYDLVAPDLPPK
ncbi:unnamed protein product [Bemisia tabaci]|uniref:ADP-ribosylhydrolase ARH3 n=1 Tax=Bemisia tabaci TaxID=7038 RepID=A0A9N9ZZ28_BEMTA|nr:unnamed protein product [Bemisia tabaci]